MISEAEVNDQLKKVPYPGFSRDIVSFGIVKGISINDQNDIEVKIAFATKDPAVPKEIHQSILSVLQNLEGVGEVKIDFDLQEPSAVPTASSAQQNIPGVKKVIAIASGKGGVGKSTVSSNLASALSQAGYRVGLCDCDLYGPSIAHMFGRDDRPLADEQDRIIPIEAHGIQLMSMGFLLSDESPVIVRGPLANRYTQQFLKQVAWNDVDILVLDLPPGTGDIQLTIVQNVSLDGAVIVTTPQEVALIDARKASSMFEKVNVPVLGVVENMSWFSPPESDEKYHIFGEGGGRTEAERLEVPFLGEIPIEVPVREGGDSGLPVVLAGQKSKATEAFKIISNSLIKILGV